MFHLKTLAFFTCAILAVSESKFVDTLNKCSIHDGPCQGKVVTAALQNLKEEGAKELGIPPLDPITFNDTTLTVMDLIELSVYDGKVKGVKDCVVDSFETDIKRGHTEMRLSCNLIVIKAKYKVSGSNPLLKNLLGGETIHGEGNAKAKLEKLRFKFDYFYDVEKHEDGEIYFNCKFNKTIYEYEVLGKTTIAADKIYLGETDTTQVILGLINENARFLIASFGKPFFDIAMQYVYDYTHKFFDIVPAKYYILEDLSPYIKE